MQIANESEKLREMWCMNLSSPNAEITFREEDTAESGFMTNLLEE
jgi:hypothetical protein